MSWLILSLNRFIIMSPNWLRCSLRAGSRGGSGELDMSSKSRDDTGSESLKACRCFPQTAPNVSECSEGLQKTPGSKGGLVRLQLVWKNGDCHVLVVDDLFIVFRPTACKGRTQLF